MNIKKTVKYPFRRLELLAADVFYTNVKLLFLRDDKEIDELYWDWFDTVQKWKQGEARYEQVEVKHDFLAAYTVGELSRGEKETVKEKVEVETADAST